MSTMPCCLASLALVSSIAVFGESRPDQSVVLQTEIRSASELKLFDSVQVPYHGYGSVSVFREGIVHITVGGEPLGFDAHGILQVSESETVSFRLPAKHQVDLVLKRKQWRLENAESVEAPARVLELDDAAPVYDTGIVGVLTLTGSLFVGYDKGAEAWLFSILDVNTGESFDYLYRPDMRDEAASKAALATCSSGPCPLGDCTITCNPPLLCQAGCGPGGEPVCRCVAVIPVPEPPFPPIPRG
jgi:hypothetical protein